MYIRILPLLIFGSFIVTYADSALQTTWSGGPGVLGPVTDWSNQFYIATDVEWSIPGYIILQYFIFEHTIDGYFQGACSIYSEDIDGDGDMDVLGAALIADDITWWENIDGSGIFWIEHTVDGDFDGARSVYSEDINGDGYMDVLGAAYTADEIAWWENIDGSGTSWTEHTVDGNFDGVRSVYSEDIDGDGDMDVLGAAYKADEIAWWENIDGSGTSWTKQTIDGDFDSAYSVYSEDIDGDGDMDILGAASTSPTEDITWWENIDGSGTSWAQHTVDDFFSGAMSVYSEDINGDGYMDVLAAAYTHDDITWWENIDGSGISWTEHTVDGDFDGARSVYPEDIDGDGDMDILGSALVDDDITWWENINGSGTSWAKHTVDGSFYGPECVYAADINDDGNMDVFGASYSLNDITWWDINGYSLGGSLESSVLDTQGDPDWDYLDSYSQTPPGTSISFQVRASEDHTSMGVWSDTLLAPCFLEGILTDGDQFVQYRAILETSNPDSTSKLHDVTITWNPLGVGDDPHVTEYLLFGAEPNPANGSPNIGFAVPGLSPVELSIFDLTGRLVIVTSQQEYSMGTHQVQLNDLTPGIYFCRMISGEFMATQRFVVIE